jgi:hypothetical protein
VAACQQDTVDKRPLVIRIAEPVKNRRPILLTLIAWLAVGSACAAGSAPGDSSTGGRPGKISADLLALHEAYRNARQGGAEFRPQNPLLRIVDDRVLIDAAATDDVRALEADLVGLGMRRAAAFGRVVSGELPIAAIASLDTLRSLAFARASMPSRRPGAPEMPGRP